MVCQVLFRYTKPSTLCAKSCSGTPNRPNDVPSPVQIHQTVQMVCQVLFRYTKPSKWCAKSCSDTLIRPNGVPSPVQIHQTVQMVCQVLFRYTNPSKRYAKSCSNTPNRPSIVTSLLYSNDCVHALHSSFHSFSYRVQLKTEPRRTATSMALHFLIQHKQ